jgi:nickel/cobalt transporter (NicO) family protein
MKRSLTLIAVLFALHFLPFPPTSAHPMPLVIQAINFQFAKDKITMEYKFSMEPLVTDRFYPVLDTNNDGKINDTEADAFSNETLKGFEGRFNNEDMVLKKVSHTTVDKDKIFSFQDSINIKYELQNPKILDTNSLFFRAKKFYVPEDPNGDLINFTDNIQDSSNLERISTEFNVEEGYREFVSYFKIKNFHSQTQTETSTGTNQPKDSAVKRFFDWSTNTSKRMTSEIFQSKRGGLAFVILGLLVAFVAGSLHAITPGHGKSMLAAFLIGKKESKFADVVTLGTSITLSHTIVIFALGFGLLFLKKTEMINKLIPYFEKVSAVILLILAIGLFNKAFQSYKHSKYHEKHGDHEHDHGHTHAWEKDVEIKNRYDLFLAGLGGGIIPCPDALSLLILSVNLGMIGFGLVLIFAFSLGLAVAIVAIGMMLLQGKKKLKLEEKFGHKAEMLSPLLTGLFICIYALTFIF